MTTIPTKINLKKKLELQPLCTKPPTKTHHLLINRKLTHLLIIVVLLPFFLLIPSGDESSVISLISNDSIPEYSYIINSGGTVDNFVQTTDGGFLLAIISKLSFRDESIPLSLPEIILLKTSEDGNVQWSRPISGLISITAGTVSELIQTSDKGFALVGHTNSHEIGHVDALLAKTDEDGILQWNRTYGGLGDDWIEGLIQTSDGGYILAGTTNSYNAGDNDMWLVKTDEYGIMEWSKTYDSSRECNEGVNGLIKTTDGGFALVGYRILPDRDVYVPHLLKTSDNGDEEWSQSYEDYFQDNSIPFNLVQTFNGKFIIAGYENKYPNPQTQMGNGFIIITNAHGIVERKIDYTGIDFSHIIQTQDGGFALTGLAAGDHDGEWRVGLLLLKTDQTGSIQWKKIFTSDSFTDNSFNGAMLVQTSDGGFTLACTANWESEPQKVAWLVKTDSVGTIDWNRAFAGAMDEEWCNDLVQTTDGGYALVGYTNSNGTGTTDMVLMKASENGKEEWIKIYGESGDDGAKVLVQTTDGGFALAGFTHIDIDPDINNKLLTQRPWLVKTDEKGISQWNRVYGYGDDYYERTFTHLFQTTDGGFILGTERRILKTDSYGQKEWNWPISFHSGNYNIRDAALTKDGGIILVGTKYFDGKLTTYGVLEGKYNISLVKINATGSLQWERVETIKDDDNNLVCALIETSDNGFAMIVSGITEGFEYMSSVVMSVNQSSYLLKTNEFGIEMWNRTFADVFWVDQDLNLIQMADGGFALAGLAHSYETTYQYLDVTDWTYQSIITDENGTVEDFINISDHSEETKAIILTTDGGFAIGGSKLSFNAEKGISFDFLLVKTDENGTVQWRQTYGQIAGQLSSWEVFVSTFSITTTSTTVSFSIWFILLPSVLVLIVLRKGIKCK